ncbi:prepilin-type N-terminal cleavage/methylation domain-containing protein [Cellulomonas fimi]|uniref:type II secretion system protein n=1 Tax=Cellulomonas fimi TaxID=1708 RepID=UPI00234CC6BF|nr:prepilin-type N-terminal cleavage/methylation domain-containing protein [Cellulomonas fimi]MDC7120802.1 prepilin-type N-terminal cleavage/methylation domain-containing protein [Cellulomonas fimi]
MIARIRKSIEEKDQGFTLIELLVVMIIIGILAAIAIPVFLNQRKKAEDSAAKADVSTLGKEIATYYVDWDGTTDPTVALSGGKYTLAGAGAAAPIGNASKKVALGDGVEYLGTPHDQNWCIDVTNPSGDKAVVGFKYSAQGGLEEGVCA